VQTVAGVFTDRDNAQRAVYHLLALGVPEARIACVTPGIPWGALTDAVPTVEAEQPGVGRVLGAVVGGAAGATAGIQLATAAAISMVLPLVGPVIATGAITGALFGLGAGAAIGHAVEDAGSVGLPRDELYVYEDALRRGRMVAIALVEDDVADVARAAMQGMGAESLDAAREDWWIGLREAEAARYTSSGGDFAQDETAYRHGFEAALARDTRGTTYQMSRELLGRRYPGLYSTEAFRRGWEGGQAYHRALVDRFGDDRVRFARP
jgi:hypothetical protein